jgi:hypothetical protein
MPSPARTSSVRSAALRTCTKPLGSTKAVMPVAVAARCRTRTSCRVSPAGRAMTAAMMVGDHPADDHDQGLPGVIPAAGRGVDVGAESGVRFSALM